MSKSANTITLNHLVHVRDDLETLTKDKERGHGDENDTQIVLFHLFLCKRPPRSLDEVLN